MGRRLLRLKQIVGCKNSGIEPIIPISRSAWWAGVSSGKYPASIKLSAKTTCWDYDEVMACWPKQE